MGAGVADADLAEALACGDAETQERILEEHSDQVADVMANGFTRRHPEPAARTGFARWQLAALAVGAATVLALVVVAPLVALALLTALVTAYSLLHAVIAVAGLLNGGRHGGPEDPLLPEAALPFYTVLVPAYREAEVIGGLVRHLAGLDYPPDRLEVLILVERHDPDTLRAVLAADPPAFVRVVRLPAGPPQTKPRSVNLGLMLARGELLVIFDAEDRPDPGQLRRVAARFAARDDRLACVQAQLLFHNAAGNWLTGQFALEYALRFGLSLPGLVRLGMPFPLGGTSNHFRTGTLRALGGWDAWNVTEDADLGMRLAALGHRAETIETVTWEEALDMVGPFVRQRTRWFKGFLMTTVVHTRHPVRTLRRFRASGALVLLGVVASAPATALVQPVTAALTVVALCDWAWSPYGAGFLAPVLVAQAASIAVWIAITFAAARRAGLVEWHAVFTPFYSVLWWVAAWRAVFQLAFSPFSWEKTPHGGSRPIDRPHVADSDRALFTPEDTSMVDRPLTLMAVHAHPDDEATGTGGVLARYAAEGVRTVLVTCTDGACGDGPEGAKPGEPGHDPAAVAAMRRRELEESCEILKIGHLELLEYGDSGMMGWPANDAPGSFWRTPVEEGAARLAELLRHYRPDVVVTYDENGFYGHPDHIQANRITMAALAMTGMAPKVYWTTAPRSAMQRFGELMREFGGDREEGDPAETAELPELPEIGLPDEEITTWVDTTEFGGQKYDALAAHASQGENIFFLRMGKERFTELMGVETFVRVHDTTGAAVPENDLFAGLR